MKTVKKILILLTALSILAMLFACGAETSNNTCTSHVDANADGKCDTCGAAVEIENNRPADDGNEIALIKDGKVNFQIVRAPGLSGNTMMVLNSLKSQIAGLGATLEIVEDTADSIQAVEVLIGDVTSRGDEYKYDKYSLGEKGYIIEKIGKKIIINAGSDNTLTNAISEFIKDVLGIKSSTKTLADVVMTKDKNVLEIQSGYRITSIKINDTDIKGYTIAYDKTNEIHTQAANDLHTFLYTKTGYYLPLVDISEAGKSIIIEAVKDAGADGFRVQSDANNALRIECAYANAFESAFANFLNNELRLKEGDINFGASYQYTEEVSVVYYKDFMHLSVNGNDYPALKAAHDFANKGGQLVKAERNKVYTITDLLDEKGKASPIIIKTNVDFGNAKILIDDTYLTSHLDPSNLDVFVIKSDYKEFALTSEELAKMFPNGVDSENLTKLDWDYNFPALLVVRNANKKVYIRYGDADYNDGPVEERGSAQSELIVIDKDGNIDPETTFMFDYTEVTGVSVYRIDETPLTITGGIFTTKASSYVHKVNGAYKVDALHRGFCSQRSNVTMKNMEYYVTNEVQAHPKDPDNKGAGYDGFFRVQISSDVTLENCKISARRYYYVRGSYGLNAHTANRVILKNCTQPNFYVTDEYVLRENGNPTQMLSMKDNWYWGVCGTSGCKNFIYDGSTLSRYDSHTNLHNGKIINSTITGIQIIGGGDMIIENSTLIPVSNVFVNLRQDYGATWKGTITIKDSYIELASTSNEFNMVYMPWVNHNFGYASYMPNIVIDNVRLSRDIPICILKAAGGHDINLDYIYGQKNNNPLQVAQFITLRNNYAKHNFLLYYARYLDDVEISDNINIIS